jgi:hypothetical protein
MPIVSLFIFCQTIPIKCIYKQLGWAANARVQKTIRSSSWRTVETLKFLACQLCIFKGTVESLLARWDDSGQVRICCEFDNEHRKACEFQFQQTELLCGFWGSGVFACALLEILDNIGETLEPVGCWVLLASL